jgi:hypothetical protein
VPGDMTHDEAIRQAVKALHRAARPEGPVPRRRESLRFSKHVPRVLDSFPNGMECEKGWTSGGPAEIRDLVNEPTGDDEKWMGGYRWVLRRWADRRSLR